MLRRDFLALTAGARWLELYHETGNEPGSDGYVGVIGLADMLEEHFPWKLDFDKALTTCLAATRTGWTNIGVWKHERVTLASLVGVNPKTHRVEFLPAEFRPR